MKKLRASLIMIFLIVGVIALFLFTNEGRVDNLIKAEVIQSNNEDVMQSSIARIGNQELQIKILTGKFKGKKVYAHNGLQGKPSIDNFYKKGDKILVALDIKDGEILNVRAVDVVRHNWELLLFGIFVVLLIIYARHTGVKALFSFVASLFIIWEFLVPGLLSGNNPIILSTFVLILLSAIIIFAIAGFTKKGVSAFLGTIIGLGVAVGIAFFFGNQMHLQGMTAPYAETLLFSGHMDLNIKYIFYAAIVIGASGAAMDIAMDIAASMTEVKNKKPGISFTELVQSGFNVGRAVIGTMTTTLLLAYSGSYLPLLMLFYSKHTGYLRMLNYKVVASEILRTLTGSIGLVLVAPITAIIAGWILIYNPFTFHKNIKESTRE